MTAMVSFCTRRLAIGLAVLALGLAQVANADQSLEEGGYIVNVNTATQEELETIPGVGSSLAKRIIAERPFKRIDDIHRVKGIGARTLERMRPYVRVEGETRKL